MLTIEHFGGNKSCLRKMILFRSRIRLGCLKDLWSLAAPRILPPKWTYQEFKLTRWECQKSQFFIHSVMWNSKSLRQEGGSSFGGLRISVLSAWSAPPPPTHTHRGVALHKPPSFKRKCLLSSDGCNSLHRANKITHSHFDLGIRELLFAIPASSWASL